MKVYYISIPTAYDGQVPINYEKISPLFLEKKDAIEWAVTQKLLGYQINRRRSFYEKESFNYPHDQYCIRICNWLFFASSDIFQSETGGNGIAARASILLIG